MVKGQLTKKMDVPWSSASVRRPRQRRTPLAVVWRGNTQDDTIGPSGLTQFDPLQFGDETTGWCLVLNLKQKKKKEKKKKI